MFKIEKNIKPQSTGSGVRKYPFDEMDIGDSFAVPPESWESIRAAASQYGKYHAKKFSVRKYGDECRCWRMA